jgi:hypothetical protein
MNEEDENIQPRLMMLSEFDGEIEGRLKYHKSLYQFREEEVEESSWAFRREERGPHDPGFSSVMQSRENLDLVEVEEDEEPHRFRLTEKGDRFVDGLKTGLGKIQDSFSEKRETMSLIASRNKSRSGSEIEEDEDIQEAKEEPYQTEV